MKSFRLFWRAVKSTRHEMWVSLQVLVATTLLLSFLLYLVEHNAQPAVFHNYWDALLWSFMGYIGDPGEFATYTPITFWGRVLKIACALVNIAIFAVPAGLVAGGFSDAIAQDKREKELEDYNNRLMKAFRRQQDPKTLYRFVPRFITIGTLQAKKNMSTKDIIDAVEHNASYRLRNLATAETQGVHTMDQLAVEMFPYNKAYGAMINRNSNITIAAPSSVDEAGIGNFAYHLALIGGFNFISKEIEADVDDPVSFYLIDNEDSPKERVDFLDDLRKLASGKTHWTIFLISSERNCDATFHFISKANAKTNRESTVLDTAQYDSLYDSIASSLKQQYDDLRSESDEDYRPAGLKNIAVMIGGGETTNAFTIRVASGFAVWDPRYIQVCKTIAKIINSAIGDPEKAPPESILKEKGTGFEI